MVVYFSPSSFLVAGAVVCYRLAFFECLCKLSSFFLFSMQIVELAVETTFQVSHFLLFPLRVWAIYSPCRQQSQKETKEKLYVCSLQIDLPHPAVNDTWNPQNDKATQFFPYFHLRPFHSVGNIFVNSIFIFFFTRCGLRLSVHLSS